MATINEENPNTDAETSEVNDSRESKRKSYPVRELKYIIEFVTKIYTELGANVFHDKEAIAKIHNLSPEYIKQPLSTCQQYGLLDLKHGVGYKVSPLFIKIVKPISESERIASIIDSIKSVEIFRSLIQDFEGHPVPPITSIANKIDRDFQLRDGVSPKVAEIFVRNLNDFGLIDSRGDLKLNNPKQEQKPSTKSQDTPPKDEVPMGSIVITIPLKGTGNRKASLHIPEDYSDADLKKIAKFVDALRDDEEDK